MYSDINFSVLLQLDLPIVDIINTSHCVTYQLTEGQRQNYIKKSAGEGNKEKEEEQE